MTKPIVAVGMMLLYEEGKWQLDDAVTKFIPEFADLRVMDRDGTLVPLDHRRGRRRWGRMSCSVLAVSSAR